MRLTFWALLATWATLLLSGEAASSNNKQIAELNSDVGVLLRDSGRFLRGEGKETVGEDFEELVADDEERGIMMKIRGFLSSFGSKYQTWKAKLFTPRFEKLVNEGNSLADVKKMYGIGEAGTPSRNNRFYKLFEQWYTAKYPNGLP